jgi:hypothetical protein
LILGAAILGLASLIGWNEFSRHSRSLETERRDLQAQMEAHKIILADRETLTARDNWITENQPLLSNPASATNDLLAAFQKAASESGVNILDTKLLEPFAGATGTEIAIVVKATSNIQNIIRLLHSVQAPSSFQSIAEFAMKSTPEPGTIAFDLKLVRHLADPSTP